ncbi:MAG: chalcone isomerase family protein, partial [Bdellovibrionota bacterium]
GVKLVKRGVLQNDTKNDSVMSIVTYGLRKKAVFGLVPVNVYVLQFLAAKPEKLVKTEDGFLASLKEAGPIQLHLTFLRNLPGEKITESFKDGLGANKIKTKDFSPELTQVLSEISSISEFKEGEDFSITFSWKSDQAVVYIAKTPSDIKTITGQKDFADQLLSIWFGKTSDSKLKELKKTLIQ